ncbi:hypothetical protein ACCS56_37530, partial [Rhizobium ruizarguesonis]
EGLQMQARKSEPVGDHTAGHQEPLDPPLSSTLGVRANGPDKEVVSALLCSLKKNLEATEANLVFRPQLTARQLHYFNLAHLSGG